MVRRQIIYEAPKRMKTACSFAPRLFYIAGLAAVCLAPAVGAERFQDFSPDKRFAVRLSYTRESSEEDLIKAIDLVSVRSKEVLVELPLTDPFSIVRLIWSQDSKWFAFCHSNGPRVSDTYVYRRSGEKFSEFNSDNLSVEVDGDVRNQYVCPTRWIRPGVLFLKQDVIFRDGSSAAVEFTARAVEQKGAFEIISKRKSGQKPNNNLRTRL